MDRREFLTASLSLLLTPPRRQTGQRGLPGGQLNNGQEPREFRGEDVLARIVEKSRRNAWEQLPMGQHIGHIGMEFVGTAYVGSTLEIHPDRESCVVNLRGLDCVTFFESTLGIARMLRLGQAAPADLVRQITLTRYRGGHLGNYATRLHYTCDWMDDNTTKGVVRMLTPDLPGAQRFAEPVYYMSTKPKQYRQLDADPSLIPQIAACEARINARQMYYVPLDRVANLEPMLNTGDIVGVTAGQKGIDCAHTGLCYRDEAGILRFLHAGLSNGRVKLDGRLSDYLKSFATGIMVVRPLDPRKR